MIRISTWKKMVIMSQSKEGLEFGGYITPSEAADIADFPDVKSTSGGMFQFHMDKIPRGICNPTWIYFISKNPSVNTLVREHCYRDHSQR